MNQKLSSQKGAVHLLLLLAAIGAVVFISLAAASPIKNKLMGYLYYGEVNQAEAKNNPKNGGKENSKEKFNHFERIKSSNSLNKSKEKTPASSAAKEDPGFVLGNCNLSAPGENEANQPGVNWSPSC